MIWNWSFIYVKDLKVYHLFLHRETQRLNNHRDVQRFYILPLDGFTLCPSKSTRSHITDGFVMHEEIFFMRKSVKSF